MRLLVSTLLVVNLGGAAHAQSPAPSMVTVGGAWARASAGVSTTGAAYLTVTETGAPDRLVGASTPVAASAEVHETIDDHGVMRMRPAGGIALEPGKPVTLAPGGLHVMLMGLRQPLHAGDRFPLTLTFEHAAPITTEILVGPPGASAAPAGTAMDHGTMDHDGTGGAMGQPAPRP